MVIMDQKLPTGPADGVLTGAGAPPSYSAAAGPSISHIQQHMCVALSHTDRVRLINCPDPTIAVVREVLTTRWRKGIDEDGRHHGAHEFVLRGKPWDAVASDSIRARQLICSLLSALHEAGWEPMMSSEVVKKRWERDTIWFRAHAPQPPAQFFVISCNEGDKLRFINAPQELIQPVHKLLGGKIQREEWIEDNAAYQWKLQGYLFYGRGEETVTSRLLLLELLDTLATLGWAPHACVDMSNGGSDIMASDSWYMRKYV